MPGWTCALIGPFYCLLLFFLVVYAAQLGSALLCLGLLGLLAAPVLLLLDVRRLSTPMGSQEMSARLKELRLKTNAATAIGLLLLLMGLFQGGNGMGFLKISSLLGQLAGSVVFLTLVASDLFLGLMKFAFDQETDLRASPLHEELRQRYADLSQVRLTDLRDDAGPGPSQP